MTVKPFHRSVSVDALEFILANCERYEVVERTPDKVKVAIYVTHWGEGPHWLIVPVWKWEKVRG